MANSSVAIDEPGIIDKRVQTYSGTVATLTVEREAMVLADPVTFGDTNEGVARVLNASPATTDYGIIVRQVSDNRTVNDTITAAADSVSIEVRGKSGVGARISGVWVATLEFQGTLDGTNYVTLDVLNVASDQWISTTTANGDFAWGALAGFRNVRVTATAFTSGTATIDLTATDADSYENKFSQSVSLPPPPHAAFMGASDGTNLVGLIAKTAAPASGDTGLVVRTVGGTTAALANFVKITDGTDTALVTAAGLLQVDASGVAVPITDNAGTLTVDAPVATPVAVRISDGVAFISPATDRTTAAGPFSARLSDGTAFLTTTGGRLSVDGSGVTQPVSGTVTANQGTAAATGWEVVGEVAHDAIVSGNPVLIAAVSEDTADSVPANRVSAEGDATRLLTDRDGALYVHPHGAMAWSTSNEFTTAQTDTSIKVAPAAGTSHYITDIFFSANGVVTATVEEGTTVLKWRHYADAAGSGASVHFITPIKLAAATAITFTTSAAITVFIGVNGYTAP